MASLILNPPAGPLPNGKVGQFYTKTSTTGIVLNGSGCGNPADYVFFVISGFLPSGLFLNPLTGLISGTPTVQGLFNFTVRLDSTAGCIAQIQAYSILITSGGGNNNNCCLPKKWFLK